MALHESGWLFLLAAILLFGEPASSIKPISFEGTIVYCETGWGEVGLNTAAHAPDKTGRPLQIGSVPYANGLGLHAPCRVVADLHGEYRLFTAEVGVQDHPDHDRGSVVFKVITDGGERFNSGRIVQGDPARTVRVELAGVQELELVVEDGGDGRECDLATWVNLSLEPAEAAMPRNQEPRFDIAPFAQVMTWPPGQKGSHPGRVEELSPGQVFLGDIVVADSDGLYTVPFTPGTESCIGLQWYENRYPIEVQLRPDTDMDPAALSGARLEWWTGESEWQGDWIPVNARAELVGEAWRFQIPRTALWQSKIGVQKVRWIFPPATRPVCLRAMQVYTLSKRITSRLRITMEQPEGDPHATLDLYNGAFLEPAPGDTPFHLEADLSGELPIFVEHLKPCPGRVKSDRAILRLGLPEGQVAVALDDVLEQGCVYMPDYGLFIAREPVGITLETHKKTLEERESILSAVRALPDQEFSRAMEHVHRTVQNNGPTMLSLACDNHKFTVYEDGGVQHRFDPPIAPGTDRHEAIANPEYPLTVDMTVNGEPLKKEERQLEDGWMPIQNTSYTTGNGTRLRQRAFTAPIGLELPLDTPGWLQPKPLFTAELVVDNPTEKAIETRLELHFFLNPERQRPASIIPLPRGAAVMRDQILVAYVDIPESLETSLSADRGLLFLESMLEAGARRHYTLYLPGWDASRQDCVALPNATSLDDSTRAYWNAVMAPALQVDIPEPLLQNVIYAGQVHCLMTARNEAEAQRVVPWCGADRYGPLESESQAIIHGMSLMGHEEFARRSLEYFIKRYNANGLLTTGYTLMGVGWHLWTLADHYSRYRNQAWLKQVAPRIESACRWIAGESEKTKRVNGDGTKPFEYGLVTTGVSADWNRFAYQARPQGEYYAGLAGMAQAFADIGYPGAEGLMKSAAAFRENILRAYTWTQQRSPAVQRRDGAWIPYCPAHFGCFGRVMDLYPNEDGGRSWGKDMSMGAHNLVTLGVLDPFTHPKETGWIAEYLEDFWCLQAGMGAYAREETDADWFHLGGFSKVQPYYTRLVELHALRDDVKPFIRAYFNALPSLLNTENLNIWEHFGNGGAWDKPHETGWFLAQTRMMLVAERGAELWLAPFLTHHWMHEGQQVTVRNAPTQFGTVGYTIRSHADKGNIEAEILLPEPCRAASTIIRLRHPRGAQMASVYVNGTPYTDFDADRECVFLPEAKGRIFVRAEYPETGE